MKRTMSWLFAVVFSVMMMLVALPSQAMAAGVQQPDKAEVAAMQVAQGPVPNPPKTSAAPAVTPESVYYCNICYTCGGGFPSYSGTIYTPSGATELGSYCSGSFTYNPNDHSPYLCCKY